MALHGDGTSPARLPQRGIASVACAALARRLQESGELQPAWGTAFAAMPRHRFLPDQVWVWDAAAKRQQLIDRAVDPVGWLEQVYRDEPAVTQWDGRADGGPGAAATSSSPRPSVVVRTLADLDVQPGMRVLQVGTGTGWTAAMLAHRAGRTVTSLEIDPLVADAARQQCHLAGADVTVSTSAQLSDVDGRFDRLLFSFARDHVGADVLDRAADGGLVLLPWAGPWLRFGIARLTVTDGRAEGRFLPYSSYAADRSHVAAWPLPEKPGDASAGTTVCAWDPWAELACMKEARFAVGLRMADVRYRHNGADARGGEALWLATGDGSSWARIARGEGEAGSGRQVQQAGPRRLWEEVDAAWSWWTGNGRPGPDRFGLTADRTGHQIWFDSPDQPLIRAGHTSGESSVRSASSKATP
ncbi:methyltransferase domain-containing protein [Streptacidiphilus sp. MAP5-52]|uniref:methyltransferase domain-containing protein n=1 Tax=Streptacidiphilus sp. MAP5-52 TaxID=3156267 RepID=UPI0035177D9E